MLYNKHTKAFLNTKGLSLERLNLPDISLIIEEEKTSLNVIKEIPVHKTKIDTVELF